MLGPSGSGKTTTLRMIAGFELPTEGRVRLHGVDVTSKPPFERDVNTVFQDYALFPHMTVGDNVGYGLMIRKVGKAERTARRRCPRAWSASTGTSSRKPRQLSGGQRQRVALARALVNRPRVLLLDEPLGALDLKLREEMQLELKAIQQEVGITFIYVTHDQEEALTMSDRMAVFNNGPDRADRHAGGRLRAPGDPRSSPASSAPRTCWMAPWRKRSSGTPARSRSGPRRSGWPSRTSRSDRTSPARRNDQECRLPRLGYALRRGARCRLRAGRDAAESRDVIDGGIGRAGPIRSPDLETGSQLSVAEDDRTTTDS